MKITKISVVALLLVGAFVSVFANAAKSDADKKCDVKSSMKCKDVAVKHAKTSTNQYACPIAVWAAEAIGPDGEVIDEAVTIWQTADGNYWIAKQLQVGEEGDTHAVKTKSGAIMKPMTKEQAKNDQSNQEYDMVKKCHPCKKNSIKECAAKEHVRSMDGKTIMCSSVDAKKHTEKTPTLDDKVSNDTAFLVIAEN